MKNNIIKLKDCYGCGVCVKICPVKIITLQENENGFYSPAIKQENKCIECGLCLKVCAFNHSEVCQDLGTEIKSFSGWSNNNNVRTHCSSGGIGFEIGQKLIEKGYEAIGVKYVSEKKRAQHYIATTVHEFMPSVGSKYIPSYTADAFAKIDRKKRYLVTGTPCQIDSMRRLIRHAKMEDNFVLLDFFCHGVPSLLMWDKYNALVRQKIGDIVFVSWRNKTTGWHDSWVINADSAEVFPNNHYNIKEPEEKHQYTSRMTQHDLFYSFFLGNYCLNKCCYKSCKYKMTASAADIRIGDLWGTKYKNNQEGVSGVISLTTKGTDVLQSIAERVTLHEESLDVVTEGQMKHCANKPSISDKIISALKTGATLDQIKKDVIDCYNKKMLPIRILNRILSIAHLPRIKF